MRYVLHHNDADGFGAAYSAYLKFGRLETTYIPIDYGWPFPNLIDGSEVYILDFSIPRDLLDSLCSRMSKVQILDHHKSAREKLGDHQAAFFDMNRSGAGIAWDYFQGTARPDFINYIEDQDLNRLVLQSSEYVRQSLLVIPQTLEDYIRAADVAIEDRISEGMILEKQLRYNLDRGIEYIHTIGVDEYKMLCVNVCLHQSNYGTALLRKIEEYGCQFAGVYYRTNQSHIKFSLRSKKDFDVSVVCGRFGGGGHQQAAGFELPIERFNFERVCSW